jgi:hypothetical protein
MGDGAALISGIWRTFLPQLWREMAHPSLVGVNGVSLFGGKRRIPSLVGDSGPPFH